MLEQNKVGKWTFSINKGLRALAFIVEINKVGK